MMTVEEDEDGRYYRFKGLGSWWRLIAGLVPDVASDRGRTAASDGGVPRGNGYLWHGGFLATFSGGMRAT